MENKEKFECADCGCYFWVEDRNNFKCPNCLSNIQDKIKDLFNELDLEEQRSLVNEISDCIEVEERKHCD